MRYLCLSQSGLRIQDHQAVTAENKSKRTDDTMDNTSDDGLIPLKKAKRFRSAFTTEQIKYLDAEFKKYPYIGSARRKEVSSALNIPERAVKIWFQNRRMKEKKDIPGNDIDCDEHKNSRKTDVANDQFNNECTVTSTNNRHYASLPLIVAKNETPIPKDVAIKKENETLAMNTEISQRENGTRQASINNPLNFYKPYLPQPEFVNNSFLESEASLSSMLLSPKTEASSTSPLEKLPQDLSRKEKPQMKLVGPLNSPGGYFPLNLKKYYAQQPSPPGNAMLWNPIQVLPVVSTGASAVSISDSHAGSLAVAPVPAPAAKKDCRCECRCHPQPQSQVLLQQDAPSPLPQYVLTALPLPNPYYKY